ncbi:uncharacterized protein LOC104582581 [Brachypodium distachyon]|uniref:Uncharacterized protein n=1 Tax=Brachypodium distachyon TaxID=15368 RepID=A0A2K2D8N3_BRADI|nr:uncharacterized protein LOC104582581 [Brachypodium distachyon]PNT70644.1 hypothetical protein BRADI_2g14981v3 [Brachypodium distachyon]|eukprot:XP_010230975.1 uncharacterized protein LOC104582581 [Brachypodium distachyon]
MVPLLFARGMLGMSRMEVTARGGEGSSLQLEGSSCGDGELAGAHVRWRLYRESTLARHTGLRGAMADLSFLLARGAPNLLGFLRSTASASGYSQLLLFRHSQSIPDLQGQPRSVVLSMDLTMGMKCEVVEGWKICKSGCSTLGGMDVPSHFINSRGSSSRIAWVSR